MAARQQIEDAILAELGADRRRRRADRQYEPGPGARPFVPPAGHAIRDLRPDQLSDLLFYLDAGYLELHLPEQRACPGAT